MDDTGVTWMGIKTEEDLDRLSNPKKYLEPWQKIDPHDQRYYPIFHEGKSWRIILKVVIQKRKSLSLIGKLMLIQES